MPRRLLIVESPAKARTIGKILGSGFSVKASVGHVRDLPKKQIGIDESTRCRVPPPRRPRNGQQRRIVLNRQLHLPDAGGFVEHHGQAGVRGRHPDGLPRSACDVRQRNDYRQRRADCKPGNVIAAGHYATERLGVQALGEHLQTRFGIDVEFVDIPNPV